MKAFFDETPVVLTPQPAAHIVTVLDDGQPIWTPPLGFLAHSKPRVRVKAKGRQA